MLELENAPSQTKLALNLYTILAISMIMQVTFITMLVGGLAMLIVVAIANAQRKRRAGHWLESHYTWMIRTFWIGAGVYLPILSLLGFLYVWNNVDINELQNTMLSGEVSDPNAMMATITEKAEKPMMLSAIVVSVPMFSWWIWRCWRGVKALRDHEAIKDVKSWI